MPLKIGLNILNLVIPAYYFILNTYSLIGSIRLSYRKLLSIEYPIHDMKLRHLSISVEVNKATNKMFCNTQLQHCL